jgi:hypothetical protein
LKEATEINVKGTRRILELCRQLPLLEVNYCTNLFVEFIFK